ncbi:MAG: ParB/RepB/Spo0J family partition protein [Bacteroidota bacterium]
MDTSKTKSVLGRGLSALIPNSAFKDSSANPFQKDTGKDEIIAAILISKIKPNPFQPRQDFDEQALSELTRSIKEKGVIQPVTVRRIEGEKYELISGERRLRATERAGLRTIPAYILAVKNDEEMLELALIENLQREHLNPIEIAISYKRLLDDCKLTQEQVAEKIGKERSVIANFLRLLRLPQKVQDAVRKEKISMGHARALLSFTDEKKLLRVYEKVIHDELPVRKVEELAKDKNPRAHSAKKTIIINKESHLLQTIETRLRQTLGTKVSIKQKQNGSGEIVIEFYNQNDLDRLIEYLE